MRRAANLATRFLGQQMDRMALYAINRSIPQNGAARFHCPVTLEDVLAQTRLPQSRPTLTNRGEHSIRLETRLGEIVCRVTVRPAVKPDAPLFIYHHGLAEHPYTSTWRRLIPENEPFPAHTVAIQAPYHTNISDPIRVGFSSTEHTYQMLAGSLSIMRLVQEQFRYQGSAYTVVGGISWGGITSLLYEGLFDSAAATVPIFASPKLSQAIWDAAELFDRRLPVSREELDRLFDFTPITERIDQRRVFPVMGEHDLFFRIENHAPFYEPDSLVTLPAAHVGAMWLRNSVLREHVLNALAWADKNPR